MIMRNTASRTTGGSQNIVFGYCFVTGAWLAINPLRSWSAYYKWLQEGKWS